MYFVAKNLRYSILHSIKCLLNHLILHFSFWERKHNLRKKPSISVAFPYILRKFICCLYWKSFSQSFHSIWEAETALFGQDFVSDICNNFFLKKPLLLQRCQLSSVPIFLSSFSLFWLFLLLVHQVFFPIQTLANLTTWTISYSWPSRSFTLVSTFFIDPNLLLFEKMEFQLLLILFS